MRQNTRELMLEILEVDNAEYSPLNREPGVSRADVNGAEKSYRYAPSPSQREETSESKEHVQSSGVVIGRLKAINAQGRPLVAFPGNPFDSVQARSTVNLGIADLDQDVVLMFEQGDLKKPIIMGILQASFETPPRPQPEQKTTYNQPVNVELAGERVTLTAKKEIVLQCGKASITLTKSGKILIRGAYVSSWSSGPNLIKGGSVQLN